MDGARPSLHRQLVAAVRLEDSRVHGRRCPEWPRCKVNVSWCGFSSFRAPLLVWALGSCNSSDGDSGPTVAPPVASVTVALPSGTLSVGQTARATVIVQDASGAILLGRPTSWSSSDERIVT